MKPSILLYFSCFFMAISIMFASGPAYAAASPLPQFEEVTKAAGIHFRHSIGDDKMTNIVESTGAGVALFDYDNDLDLDLYLVSGCYHKNVSHPKGRFMAGRLQNALYRNNGDGTFTDVTDEAGVGDKGFGMACLAADYDNDGDKDLFITNYGPNTLYRNNGDKTFTEVTGPAGLEDDLWSVGCTFFDYDRDGHLDLYIANYLQFDPEYNYYYQGEGFPGPLSYQGEADKLYHNKGDGTFEDVSQKAGIANPRGRGMGVASCDINDDGYIDVYVANDGMENYLYQNNGDGTFTNVALDTGTGFGQNGEATSAMGPEFGDYNLDGLIDILVPDMGYSCLYRNTGEGYFEDMSALVGLATYCGQYTSWSGNFFDFDQDGRVDIFIANGDSRYLEPEENLMLRNTGETKFENVSAMLGPDFQTKYVSRGSAVGDIDHDGDLDLVILNINGPAQLLLNQGGNRNNWLMIHVVGSKSNRDAVGTRIRLTAGGTTQTRYTVSSSGYLSQSDYRAHFGLGDNTLAEKIEIRWPDGQTQVLENEKVNRVILVIEPEGQ